MFGKTAGIVKQTHGKFLGSVPASRAAKKELRMCRSERAFGDHLVQPLMVWMENSGPKLKRNFLKVTQSDNDGPLPSEGCYSSLVVC